MAERPTTHAPASTGSESGDASYFAPALSPVEHDGSRSRFKGWSPSRLREAPHLTGDHGPSQETVEHARAILSRHARSFRWAAQFLPPEAHDDAAILYAMCRTVDDLADESADVDAAQHALAQLEAEMRLEAPPGVLVEAFLDLCRRRQMDIRLMFELIEGVRSDLGPVIFETDTELLRYCYRVAGTVGLMMCAVIGVDEPQAAPYAIDLGIGMQLTNICRDVREDAERGRIYLPEVRLRHYGLTPDDVFACACDARTGQRPRLAYVTRDIVQLAEQYYLSGQQGMHFIPGRTRTAIMVASRLYRSIGLRLMEKNASDAMKGRTIVPWTAKIRGVVEAFGDCSRPSVLGLWGQKPHDSALHAALRGLPGVHER